MKRKMMLVSVLALVLILTACTQVDTPTAAPTELIPTETMTVATEESAEEELATEEPERFPQVYTDEAAGIQFSYPEGWTLSDEQVVGERASQIALLSPGSTLEMTADGGARIVLVTYQWDPKNDLSAYITQRITAWEASGFSIQSEKSVDLGNGQTLVLFDIKTAEQTQVLFAFTNSGEDYLQLSGDGDLDLCREILETVALIH